MYEWYTATTTGNVESIVSRNLDHGATTDDIFTFLDAKGWYHGKVQAAVGDSLDQETGVPVGTLTIFAEYPDSHVKGCFPFNGMIVVYFLLDDARRLSDYRTVYQCITL